jgi:hypothetical protein
MTLVILDDDQPAQLVERVPEGNATREASMRDLIFDHPTILPIAELEPGIGQIIAVAKEVHLPGAGFIDVLLISEHGRLIVVECKLWRNPQARREVVGQILDYARELSRYAYEDLQRTISSRLDRRGNVLFDLVRDGGGQLIESTFVDRVTRDLAAGRFLLLVVGDGITEGTRRIGEFLGGQAGLAFDFGLVEIAEYRFVEPQTGVARRIMQPRLLARTAVIERHVIKNVVPNVIVEEIEDVSDPDRSDRTSAPGRNAEAISHWRTFLQQFVKETQFDDPAQLSARYGGLNWMRLPLPGPAALTLWRSRVSGKMGGFLRYNMSEGVVLYDMIAAEHEAIDAEFAAANLPSPRWMEKDDTREVGIRLPCPLPWDVENEAEQRRQFARVGNQFVNSFRPRLLRLTDFE